MLAKHLDEHVKHIKYIIRIDEYITKTKVHNFFLLLQFSTDFRVKWKHKVTSA